MDSNIYCNSDCFSGDSFYPRNDHVLLFDGIVPRNRTVLGDSPDDTES